MVIFIITQVLFDTVLLFSILFLFHYSTSLISRKKEDIDLINDIQIQEMKNNLQELLLIMKEVGKKVTDEVRAQVESADKKKEELEINIHNMKILHSKINKSTNDLKCLLPDNTAMFKGSNNTDNGIKKNTRGTNEIINVPKKGFKKPQFIQGEEMVSFSSSIVKEIYRLVDDDYELNEIAKITKLSLAEIQLILNLRGRNFTTPN